MKEKQMQNPLEDKNLSQLASSLALSKKAVKLAGQIANAKPPRQRKNWLHVNIGAYEQKQIRCLLECCGGVYRTFLELAIRHEVMEVEKLLKIKSWKAPGVPPKKRKALGRSYRKLWAAIGYRNVSKN
jgi:hypothetical protein